MNGFFSSQPGAAKRVDISVKPDLLLDISRLLVRASQKVPTGVDRVELAWAEYLLDHHADRLYFSAVHPLGLYGTLPLPMASAFIRALSARWRGEFPGEAPERLAKKLRRAVLFVSAPSPAPGCHHLIVSHHHLTRPRLVARVLRRYQAQLATLIHDLIPIEFPEYGRKGEANRHLGRLRTTLSYSRVVFTPSAHVRDAVLSYGRKLGFTPPPVHVLPLGVSGRSPAGGVVPAAIRHRGPFFLFISTIEPRKNHLLVLKIWRRLVERFGQDAPDLVLIGKRGWENENVLDMLDRCPGLMEHVHEYNSLPDTEVIALIKACRALLFPSFAEGYGLPLAEAFALDAPVICSDIPVFREIGGEIPDYVDPLDGPGWEKAIMAYLEDTGARSDQMQRLKGWHPRSWEESIREAVAVLNL